MLQRILISGGLLFILASTLHAVSMPAAENNETKKVKEIYKSIWEKTYGGKYDDIGEDIVALENGESAIVGTCKSFDAQRTDICILRMNAEGKIVWRMLLGGKKDDQAKAITRAADGNLFVLGMTKSLAKDYDKDIYVAKVSLDGRLIWEKAMGGSRDEYPGGIVGTTDGGVIFVGDTESFGRQYKDIYIGKLSKEGKPVFARTVGGEKADEAHSLTRVKDGNFVLVGMRDTEGGGHEEFFVMKIDQNGKNIWSKTFGEYDDDSLESVIPTIDGGIVAVGKTRSYGSEQTDLTVMKLNNVGKVLWHKVYGFKYYEYGNAVTMTKDGGFMIAGGTNTLGKGSHDVYMLALDKNGELIWSHAYGDKNRDVAHGIARMSDGSIITVGESDSFSHAKDIYMIKIDKNK